MTDINDIDSIDELNRVVADQQSNLRKSLRRRRELEAAEERKRRADIAVAGGEDENRLPEATVTQVAPREITTTSGLPTPPSAVDLGQAQAEPQVTSPAPPNDPPPADPPRHRVAFVEGATAAHEGKRGPQVVDFTKKL